MMSVLGPVLTAVLLAQTPADQTAAGTVVDDQGKPVAGALVVLYAPPVGFGTGDPAQSQASTDAEGRFHFKVPPLGRVYHNGIYVWAFRPGLGISAVRYRQEQPHRLALQKAEPRTVKVEGPDGQPVAGTRVCPRVIFTASGGEDADMPATLAEPLAVTTGPNGKAALACLKGRDRLVAARITADPIGTQDILVDNRPRQGSEQPAITFKLRNTGRLAGRIVSPGGQGVADQAIEIWARGDGNRVVPSLVGFKNGPMRTGADGAFQTPDNLMVGSTYRVAVRERGKEPVISDWITISNKPAIATLAPIELRPLRTLTGRVVGRQGNPIANVEVFQSGDGPERTAVKTDAEGRFALGGFPQGPVFLFARAEGYRFHGQLIKTIVSDITVELTRTGEPPARPMKKLPDPIPLEESRALAHRLLDPWWQAAVAKGDEGSKYFVIRFLIPADPIGALEKVGAVKFPTEKSQSVIQGLIARALARRDFEEAETVAESIVDAGAHAGTLARMADLVPNTERQRKLALLERATIQAKATTDPSDRVYQLGQVASRLYELGEVDKAKALCAEGLRRAKESNDQSFRRRSFLALLARLDLPAALDLARPHAQERPYGSLMIGSIAFGLAWDNPAEAQRFLSQYPPEHARDWLTPTVTWKIATLDPVRARQLVESLRGDPDHPEHQICLALGAKGRDETIARQAIQEGLRGLDRLMPAEALRVSQTAERLLPIAEAIDPGLVPELFWRAIAARYPSGNPRRLDKSLPSYPIRFLCWYDRDVAAALFEPTRQRLEKATDKELIHATDEFETWCLFDPRAAVARLEKVPMPSVNPNDNRLRIYVIEKLALDHEQRWIKTWNTRAPIFDPSIRDAMWNPY
jgi:Carboxypeptidase regulatory-like domain